MKLIIQIPCRNEEATLPATLADLPRDLEGFDEVEWLVIDDGSTDRTAEVAREGGVDHLVRLTSHQGLANAFQAGLDAALKLGADVVVNTDADNQYRADGIALLVAPILAGEADMVVGEREISGREDIPRVKRALHRVGAKAVRRASATSVPDPTSGFRAYNREAALSVQVVSTFTYTLESIIQAGRRVASITSVPIATNPPTRPSRLFGSVWEYSRRNAVSILRIYAQYEPLRIFWSAAVVVALAALAIWGRFLYFLVDGDGSGHVQSLILGAVLLQAAMLLFALGLIGDLLHAQRVLTQRTLERVRRVELALGVKPSHHEPLQDSEAPRIGEP